MYILLNQITLALWHVQMNSFFNMHNLFAWLPGLGVTWADTYP